MIPIRQQKVKISKLYEFDGLNKVEVKEAAIGSIVAVSGIADIHIGDTLCSPENPDAIPFQKISEPTISMQFMVNDSPSCRYRKVNSLHPVICVTVFSVS